MSMYMAEKNYRNLLRALDRNRQGDRSWRIKKAIYCNAQWLATHVFHSHPDLRETEFNDTDKIAKELVAQFREHEFEVAVRKAQELGI